MYTKLTTAAAVVALAFGLAACGGGGGSDDTAQVTTPPAPTTPPTPPAPTDLETAQAAAAAAATAAKTASDAAAMAASDASDATANLATMQTGAMAKTQADAAQMQAAAAMTAYMAAKAASDMAAEAEDATAAIRAQIAAESAQADAEAAAEAASEASEMAMTSAMGELMIDGTMKSVGETTIDAMAGKSDVTTGSGDDAQRMITGLIGMNPMATGGAITGNERTDAVADNLGTAADETAKAIPYKQAAAARTFAIGKTLDSSDDMARLMLVTRYAGLEMVKVFSAGDASTTREGSKPGYISITSTTGDASTDAADANNTALRSVGTFYPVSGGTAGTLAATDSVAHDAKPVEVFSYSWTTDADPPVTTTVYATLTTTSTTDGVTTYTYNIGADIDAAVLQDGPDEGSEPDVGQVTSGIPAAVDYEHLHFGVWASLDEAAKDGSQNIADLGIGFVQSIGDGMTGADMPNADSATYNGNWVAAVRRAHAAGAGGLSLEDGVAMLMADFGKATITADLVGLAKLEGGIDGNSFSGTKATATGGGLATGGTFTGSFGGGFYGAKAAEAGGTFDFTSEGMRAGEFRGSFGGKKAAE